MPLAPNRISLAEYKRNLHRVTTDAGTKFEEILAPEYWQHAAGKLRNGDRIEVLSADNAFFGELLVLSVQQKAVVVRVISYADFSAGTKQAATKPPKETPKFRIEYKGNINKYCVIRTADKEVVKEGFDLKDQAAEWLEQYELGLA